MSEKYPLTSTGKKTKVFKPNPEKKASHYKGMPFDSNKTRVTRNLVRGFASGDPVDYNVANNHVMGRVKAEKKAEKQLKSYAKNPLKKKGK